jgi:hypothetical protein
MAIGRKNVRRTAQNRSPDLDRGPANSALRKTRPFAAKSGHIRPDHATKYRGERRQTTGGYQLFSRCPGRAGRPGCARGRPGFLVDPPARWARPLLRLTIYYSWIVLDLGRLTHRSMALIESVPEVTVATSTTLSSLHEARRAVVAIRGSGWGGDKLGLAVSELPDNQRLSERKVPNEPNWHLNCFFSIVCVVCVALRYSGRHRGSFRPASWTMG